MNAPDGTTRQRWLGLAGAAAVVAIPIALIVATWEPLEPVPRADRPARVEEATTPERTREERRERRPDVDRPSRRNRERGQDAAPAIATPRP